MSRSPRAVDLRERMQRVATKPRKPDTAPAPRQARHRRRPVALTRPSSAAAVRRAPSTTTAQSRARTLAAWASWELTSVPARRWNWLIATIRGRPTS
jgi:hypothetical protein